MEKFEKDLEERVKVHQDEVNEFKEHIRQHALTICTLEEGLNVAATKNRDFQAEITSLKSEISGWPLFGYVYVYDGGEGTVV